MLVRSPPHTHARTHTLPLSDAMDPGRGRRERAPKRGAAALAELAALRRGDAGGGADTADAPKKRLDAFELKEEGDVYDVVTEEEYADLVSKRRREGGEYMEVGGGGGVWENGLGSGRAPRHRAVRVAWPRWAGP